MSLNSTFRHEFSTFNIDFLTRDDDNFTFTSTEQKRVEDLTLETFKEFICDNVSAPELLRGKHVAYLIKSILHLTRVYETLDASRPWLCYWTIHSLALLGEKLDSKIEENVISFLKCCQNENGGYGGGPGQISHLATTYAAVMTLCTIGTNGAYESINRTGLSVFLRSMKQHDGGFRMHSGGESDIRGVYCALSVASLLNLMDEELIDKSAEWVVSCQTYEGGFGGVYFCEAHGGYTFCALATLALLGKSKLAYTDTLLKWLVRKQKGRTNKLVDGCYSYWQAASFPIVEMVLKQEGKTTDDCLFDGQTLQEFILICCQDKIHGGLRDKPEKSPDLYHTCYALSGLSIAQNSLTNPDGIVGGCKNALIPTHPIYNIINPAAQKAKSYFSSFENVD